MLPVIPKGLNKLIQDSQGRPSTFPFPKNIAGDADCPKPLRQKIYRWMLQNYVWPQIMERQPYEERWNRLLRMAKASWNYDDMHISEKTRLDRQRKAKEVEGITNPGRKSDISDTIIYDAVDRLTNLNHFISFKDKLPVKYQWPEEMDMPYENSVYSPSDRLIRAANGWLKFNADGSNFYRNHWIATRHYYTYGVTFISSEFSQKIGMVQQRQPDNTFKRVPELLSIGTSFEPISIRKMWLNYRLTAYQMDLQPCPFFYEVTPRFAIIANPYDQVKNPFGYLNLDTLPTGQWLFSAQETSSFEQALKLVNSNVSLTQLTPPELGIELNWIMYPMLPLLDLGDQQAMQDLPQTTQQKVFDHLQSLQTSLKDGEQMPTYLFDDEGKLGLPLERYIMELFGINLASGLIEMTRLQKNYYPHDSLPIYGSAHMPSADEGMYSSAIGDILECHFVQVTKALNQYLDNKDLINDPPTKIMTSSPANTKDLNRPGAKIKVNSMKDYEKDTIVDGTATTPTFLEMVRDQARTSSKAVDAILGKALGSRTSATEASNTFQTAMSGVTTDVNLLNYDLSGGYATRVREYGGLWVDPDILASITGQYGMALTSQQLQIRLGLKWDIGSTYIESITRQQNIRYILETLGNNPAINVPYLVKLLLKEWKFTDLDNIVNDQGLDENIKLSNLQACETYMGEMVMVDPDQDHNVAIKVKVSYLKDRDSVWNTNPVYAINGPKLVQQIQVHQMYLQLQQLQQQAQAMQMQAPDVGKALQAQQQQQQRQQQAHQPPALVGQNAQAH